MKRGFCGSQLQKKPQHIKVVIVLPKAPKQANLTIKTLKIAELTPHPKNPRVHSKKQIDKLKTIISSIGFAKGSVVIQNTTGYILAGHGVVQALTELGYTTVDVVVADLSDSMAEAFMLADNRLGEDSTWDREKLEIVLEDLRIENIDLHITGFEDGDILGPQNPEELWENMPEFEQNNAMGARTIIVHFQTLESVKEFTKLIKQDITENTRYIWFPELKNIDGKNFHCIDNES